MAEGQKKQIPLRLSPKLYDELVRWADDEFRSVNGQIEYLLTECVKKRRQGNSEFRIQNSEVSDENTRPE